MKIPTDVPSDDDDLVHDDEVDGLTKSPTAGKSLRFFLGVLGGCVAFGVLAGMMLRGDTRPIPASPPPPRLAAVQSTPKAPQSAAPNALTYLADASGHYFVDAVVNDVPMRFLVDTGATVVALSPDDARALGIDLDRLDFSGAVNTANGQARVAPTELREIRLGQLSIDNVSAVVMEQPMGVSLLGMSFLSRVSGYSIRDGVLTIEW